MQTEQTATSAPVITVRTPLGDYSCPAGTTYREIAAHFAPELPWPVLLVREENRLKELSRTCEKSCDISFVTMEDKEGRNAYSRSLCLMMLKAFSLVLGGDEEIHIWIRFTVSSGLFCTMDAQKTVLTQELLDRVMEQMRALQRAALPIEKSNIHTDEAIELFEKNRMSDKAKLFRFRITSRTNLYALSGFRDYYYGCMVPDTSYLSVFDLVLYGDGFVLRMPEKSAPGVLPPFEPVVKLFEVQNRSRHWGETMGLDSVGDLNEKIVAGDIKELILVQEAYHEKQMAQIAEEIVKTPGRRMILIAGPSSSSKTTFSHRLSTQLSVHGLRPHPVPMDDYFKNREDTPRDADGNYDFERLEAIDVDLFGRDMEALLAGERVELPTFNFKTGHREYKGHFLELGERDILVIEGIHGLNDALSASLPREAQYRIYISALTQLNIDEHNRIPTSDGRLLRRIVRDARTRGYSAQETIAMWRSVRRGEENYIFPFQENADVMFNSALIYELAVMKIYAAPLLHSVPVTAPEYPEARRLLKFLDYFLPIPPDDIPKNSLVREFIGGSCFDV